MLLFLRASPLLSRRLAVFVPSARRANEGSVRGGEERSRARAVSESAKRLVDVGLCQKRGASLLGREERVARDARARARGARSKQAGAAERNGARGGERAGESGWARVEREGARNAGANPNRHCISGGKSARESAERAGRTRSAGAVCGRRGESAAREGSARGGEERAQRDSIDVTSGYIKNTWRSTEPAAVNHAGAGQGGAARRGTGRARGAVARRAAGGECGAGTKERAPW